MQNVIAFSVLPCTPIIEPFVQALEVFAKTNDCEIIALKQKYRIPTSKKEAEKLDWEDVYTPRLNEYYADGDRLLFGGRLQIFDKHVAATANNPLSAILTGAGMVTVLGHAKLFMKTLDRHGDSQPAVVTTTGTVSERKYSNSAAGHRSHTHHSIRALCFLGRADGGFDMRHLAWDGEKIMDLSGIYYPDRYVNAPTVNIVQLSDLHCSWIDPRDAKALQEFLARYQPNKILVGDIWNWERFSHHNMKRLDRDDLEGPLEELEAILELLGAFPAQSQVIIQDSNHHNHLSQWIERWERPRSIEETQLFHQFLGHYLESKGRNVQLLQVLLEATGYYGFDFVETYMSPVGRAYTHGHEGMRGSAMQLRAKYAFASSAGHHHRPGREHHAITVGCMARPSRAGYVSGTTGWAIAHTVEYFNGKAELVYQTYAN